MKGRRRILLVLAACGVVVMVAAVFWPREREPEYQGKTLSEWLRLHFKAGTSNDVAKMEASSEAVRQIGTNALPWLLRWIEHDEPEWRERITPLLRKLPDGAIKAKLLERESPLLLARVGFKILGARARPAMPELIRIIYDERSANGGVAISLLGELGEDALPALISIATNNHMPNFSSRAIIGWRNEALTTIDRMGRMGSVGTNGNSAVRVLVQSLDEEELAESAALALGGLGLESDTSVPALMRCLGSTNWYLRLIAMKSLGQFGKEAGQAVPSLMKLLSEPGAEPEAGLLLALREGVTNALRKIAPEVLENRGVK